MIQIAIVEDDRRSYEILKNYLNHYAQENSLEFEIHYFENAVALLDHYTAAYDIIFMDIQMPLMNGMDAAHRLRALDQIVLLIFVTNMTQYAISGYEVDALYYLVKPINYYDFALKLSRAIKKIPQKKPLNLMISTTEGMLRLDVNDIYYIETQRHLLIYHTSGGDYRQYGSLNKLETKIHHYGFARCNSCYLVNMKYVTHIKGYILYLGKTELKISQPRKKDFLQQLIEFTEGELI